MDVTRVNFNDVLPVISKAINQASFVSFDTEFSGLSNGTFNLTLFDSPEERYEKLLHNIGDFQLLQFGLSIFFYDNETQKFKVDTYNFFIFPFPYACSGYPDRIFSCQSSSIDFLINQSFDFNKVFKKGLPYLRLTEEASVCAILKQKQERRESIGNTNLSPMDQEAKAFLDDICKQVQSFLSDSDQNELFLAPCNSYLRKILYENVPLKFPDLVSLDAYFNEETKQRQIIVRRGNNDMVKKAKLEELKMQDEAKFQNAVGFSKIIKLLTESNKLVIGHNMLLDLLFTIKQFVTPLPPSLDEFKVLVQNVFPQLVDTKLMGSLLPFKELLSSTALGDLYSQLQTSPFCPPSLDAPEKYKADDGLQKNQQHDAGYDSFITGCSFLSMFCYLQKLQKSSTPFQFASFEIVTPYINKVCIMKTFDLPYINLGGSDLKPNHDHVFHVTFPSEWKPSDLRQLFSPFGNITLSWINDTSCFVCLHDISQAKHVKEMMLSEKTAEPRSYHITSYVEHCSAKKSFASLSNKLHVVNESPLCSKTTSQVTRSHIKRSGHDNSESNESRQSVKKQKLQDDGDANKASAELSSSENLCKENKDKSMLFDVPTDW